MPGNWASDILVSCRHRTSGPTCSNHSSTLGMRAFREFTFHVAISTRRNLREPEPTPSAPAPRAAPEEPTGAGRIDP